MVVSAAPKLAVASSGLASQVLREKIAADVQAYADTFALSQTVTPSLTPTNDFPLVSLTSSSDALLLPAAAAAAGAAIATAVVLSIPARSRSDAGAGARLARSPPLALVALLVSALAAALLLGSSIRLEGAASDEAMQPRQGAAAYERGILELEEALQSRMGPSDADASPVRPLAAPDSAPPSALLPTGMSLALPDNGGLSVVLGSVALAETVAISYVAGALERSRNATRAVERAGAEYARFHAGVAERAELERDSALSQAKASADALLGAERQMITVAAKATELAQGQAAARIEKAEDAAKAARESEVNARRVAESLQAQLEQERAELQRLRRERSEDINGSSG